MFFQVLQSALVTFDLMESLVARIEEISEERVRLSVWNRGLLPTREPQDSSCLICVILEYVIKNVCFWNSNVKKLKISFPPENPLVACGIESHLYRMSLSISHTGLRSMISARARDILWLRMSAWGLLVACKRDLSYNAACTHTYTQNVQFWKYPTQTSQSSPWQWPTSLWPCQHSFAQAEPWDCCQRTWGRNTTCFKREIYKQH